MLEKGLHFRTVILTFVSHTHLNEKFNITFEYLILLINEIAEACLLMQLGFIALLYPSKIYSLESGLMHFCVYYVPKKIHI